MPSFSASRAICSQARHSSLAKSSPAAAPSSVTGRSPLSPYQPTAEPDNRRPGRCSRASSHSTRRSVRRTRLSHSRALRLWLQGLSAIGSPARLTTASSGWSPYSSKRSMPRTPTPHSDSTCCGLRLNTVSRCPACRQRAHRRRPIRPVPPVKRMCMAVSSFCLRALSVWTLDIDLPDDRASSPIPALSCGWKIRRLRPGNPGVVFDSAKEQGLHRTGA